MLAVPEAGEEGENPLVIHRDLGFVLAGVGRQLEVLQNAQVAEDVSSFRDQADTVFHDHVMSEDRDQVCALEGNPAFRHDGSVRRGQAHDAHEGGRFPGAIGP